MYNLIISTIVNVPIFAAESNKELLMVESHVRNKNKQTNNSLFTVDCYYISWVKWLNILNVRS